MEEDRESTLPGEGDKWEPICIALAAKSHHLRD